MGDHGCVDVAFPIRIAEPEHAVPAGRLGYDLTADRLLLHTVQTDEAFDSLVSTGSLISDPALAEPTFADAYDWMLRQMATRLPTQGTTALWLWARISRRELVGTCRRSRGEVLLTCHVPRERVVLSHFLDWHLVLNRGLCVPRLPGESDEDNFHRWEKASDSFDAQLEAAGVGGVPVSEWPTELRDQIEQSWESILDPANYGRYECWQATLHTLHTDDVVDAVRLTR